MIADPAVDVHDLGVALPMPDGEAPAYLECPGCHGPHAFLPGYSTLCLRCGWWITTREDRAWQQTTPASLLERLVGAGRFHREIT